jgi:hypothetical protein
MIAVFAEFSGAIAEGVRKKAAARPRTLAS